MIIKRTTPKEARDNANQILYLPLPHQAMARHAVENGRDSDVQHLGHPVTVYKSSVLLD
jgi:hypothetical protein